MDGETILRELLTFMAEAPSVFPQDYDQTWSPPLTAFFVHLGVQQGYHVRCGDQWKKVEVNHRTRNGAVLPAAYAPLIAQWDTNGLLDTDAAWVPQGFTIPKDFSSCPTPARSEIYLIYEHEDESTMYRDDGRWTGTRMTVALDEIRKIGNVRSDVKVLSYVTSQSEIEAGGQIPAIQAEIRLIRDAEALTRRWVILQMGRYLRPASDKAAIERDGVRQVFIRMTELDGRGDLVGTLDRYAPGP